MSTFVIYLIGYLIFVIGVAVAAFLLGAPPLWIGVVSLILIGLGIAFGVGQTRQKDQDAPD